MQDACWRPTDPDRTARIARPRAVPRRPRTAGAVVLERRVDSAWSPDGVESADQRGDAATPATAPASAAFVVDRSPHRAISVPRQPPSSRTIGVLGMGLVIAMIVAIAMVGARALVPPQIVPPSHVLPAGFVARWRVDAGAPIGPNAFAADADRAVLLMGASVVVFDARAGTPLWRRDIADGPASVHLVDGVVVTVVDTSGATNAAGFDAASGTRLWSWSRANSTLDVTGDGLVERLDWSQSTAIRVLDPRSGSPVSPAVEAIELIPSPGLAAGGVASGVALLDVGSGAVVGWSTMDDGVQAVAVVGGRTVAFADGDLVLSARSGAPVGRYPVPTEGDGPVGIMSADGSIGVLVAEGVSTGFEVVDDDISVRWTLAASVSAPVETTAGPLAVARSAGELAIVDVRTGQPVVSLVAGQPDPLVAYDGYIVPPVAGDAVSGFRVYGFDGRLRWSVPAEPGTWFAVAGGTLYVGGSDGMLTARR